MLRLACLGIQSVCSARRRPLETHLITLNGVVVWQTHGIGGAAETAFWVVLFGQHVHVEVAIPFVVAVTGYRQETSVPPTENVPRVCSQCCRRCRRDLIFGRSPQRLSAPTNSRKFSARMYSMLPKYGAIPGSSQAARTTKAWVFVSATTGP